MKENRGSWGSNIGFILATAGSAVGLGNLWKFPYLVGKNGGGAFVIVYLFLVVLLGFSLMLAEMAIGRNGKSDAYGSYRKLNKKLGIAGFLGIFTCFVIFSYYSVIAGWIVKYVIEFIKGGIGGDVAAHFGNHISSPVAPIVYTAIVLLVTAFVVLKGVSGGIEKAGKIMMPALFISLIVITVRVLTLPGAMEGVKYYLTPDFSKINGQVILAALGQVFFSLSLGMGVMITYGSYLDKKPNIVKNSLLVTDLDTIIALIAGLAIIPATIAFGHEVTAGPGLIFITLPSVFAAMPLGSIFGTVFFILVLFAALTSTISLLEVVVAFVVDQAKIERKKATVLITVAVFILAILNSLSFGPLAGVTLFFGMNFFDFLCYLTDNLLLPIGGIMLCVGVGYVWKEADVVAEVTNGGTVKFRLVKVWLFVIRYIIPVVLVLILLQSIGVLKI